VKTAAIYQNFQRLRAANERNSTIMTSSLADLSLDQLSIDTLRLLAVDAVEKANSGHPGAPLGCAPIAYLLFHKLMKHNPAHSKWADRDRLCCRTATLRRCSIHAVSVRLQREPSTT
jgi:transketolase N-terminal domain/subunit